MILRKIRAKHIDSRFIGLSTTGLMIRALRNFEAIQTIVRSRPAITPSLRSQVCAAADTTWLVVVHAHLIGTMRCVRAKLVAVSELKRSGYATIITASSMAMTMITDPRAERNPRRLSRYAQSTCFPSRG